MRASASNFLYFLKQIVTGGGRADPSSGTLQAADGGFLRDVDYSNELFTAQSISSTAFVTGKIAIPRDYDETVDTLQLWLTGSTGSNGGTLTVQSKLVSTIIPNSTGVFVSSTVSTSIALPSTSTLNFMFGIDLSGQGLKRGSIGKISTVASGQSGIISVTGGFLTYASDLVAYNEFAQEVISTSVAGRSQIQPVRG